MASFEGAPLCRMWCVGGAVGSVLVTSEVKGRLALRLGRLLAYGEVWRLGTHHLLFDTAGEAALGALALYRLRRLERYAGSRKFGAFALLASAATTLGLAAVNACVSRARARGVHLAPASGPYGLIFAGLAVYWRLVPVSRPKLVGFDAVRASEKSLVYARGLRDSRDLQRELFRTF